MTRVAILANCQGGPLRRLIEACLPGVTATLISNSPRAGAFASAEQAADALGSHDIIVAQALGREHGAISDEAIRARYREETLLRFAYIYNGGIGTLGYAPQSPINSYGQVIGEASIIAMIRDGVSQVGIEARIAAGDYTPDLRSRFDSDLAEMARREAALEVKLCGFIAERYRRVPLFLTHNHPTFALSAELLRRVVRLIAPSRAAEAESALARVKPKIADLPYTGAPISPHDARVHGYAFGYHSDWAEKQRHLIDLVWRSHKLGETVKSAPLTGGVRLPDVAPDAALEDGRGTHLVAHLRGRGDVAIGADAVMAVTRDR